MYITHITVAGLTVRVEHFFEEFTAFASRFLSSGEHCDFSVTVTREDLQTEYRILTKQRLSDGRAMGTVTGAMLEQTAVYRKIAAGLLRYGAVVFHGAAIAVENRAVLFTALSGTGKTTHAKLWLKNIKNSYIVNGDKPILRIMDGTVYACGTPWNGKEQFGTNKNVPLTGICYLHRGETNRIERTDANGFLPLLLQQTHCPEGDNTMRELLPIIKQIAQNVSFYHLYCNMEDEAAQVSYAAMLP